MSKDRIFGNILAFAIPFILVLATGIPNSKHIWVQSAGIGLAVGLLLGAGIMKRTSHDRQDR